MNGVVWRVYIVPPYHPALRQPNGKQAIGCCDKDKKIIFISAAAAHQPLFTQVLCHEVAHAAIDSYSIDLPFDEEEFLASFISVYGDDILAVVNSFIK